MNKGNRLILFNLKTDETDNLLSFTSDWIRAFSDNFENIEVISTHVGKNSLPKKIDIYELGGGSFFARILAVAKLLLHGLRLSLKFDDLIIFHHMSTYTAFLVGPLFKIRGFRQGLWYSHNRDSKILRFACLMVDAIFTPSEESFPFNSEKVHIVGHGIDLRKFQGVEKLHPNRSGIVSLGRISRVKQLDGLIKGVVESGLKDTEISFIGPVPVDERELKYLSSLCDEVGVHANFLSSIPYQEVPVTLSKYSMCFSGSPRTVDKSVIEGALAGCFVLSESLKVLQQTGMIEIWKQIEIDPPTRISGQIQILKQIEKREDLRLLLAKSAQHRNNLDLTVNIITSILRKND